MAFTSYRQQGRLIFQCRFYKSQQIIRIYLAKIACKNSWNCFAQSILSIIINYTRKASISSSFNGLLLSNWEQIFTGFVQREFYFFIYAVAWLTAANKLSYRPNCTPIIQILLMFVKDFFLEVAQKKGRTKRTHQIAGFEKMM